MLSWQKLASILTHKYESMNMKIYCIFNENAFESAAKISIFKVSPSGKSHDNANEVKVYTINLDGRNLVTWLIGKAHGVTFRVVPENE